jgi:SdrD B-like domain/GEVED domain/F5/8 type C domain/Secretion system C-terminal sorting domain
MLSIYKIYHAFVRIALIIALLCCNYIAFAQCDPAGTIISFSTTGNNTSAGFVTKYLLTDAAGLIIQQVNSPFAAPNTPANYKVYTINYDAATGTAPTLTAGTNIAAIGGTCVVINTTPLLFTVCAPIQIQGTVFQDANGLTDATVNGTGTNVSGLLRANLLNAGVVVQSVLVAADGTFTFPNVAQGTNYTVIIATSATATTPNLPTGWVNTGENLGIAAGNDGTVNGIQTVNVTTTSVVEVDFGIERKPAALFLMAAPQLNPGGTTQVTLDPATFGGTDPDGTIASLTLTAFPNNAASITVNGTTYTAATFPVGGITIPTNAAGQPTQTITADPNTGAVSVVFPYKTTDNAGFSGTSGSATFPFTLPPVLSITGTVFEDLNALTNNMVDGIGSNAGGLLYANLLSGGVVVQSVLLPANGAYTFPNVAPNTTYTVVLTTSATATTPAIPANYFNTGEGVLAAGDGTVNGETVVNVVTTTINNVNFGIRQTCEPPASTITFSNTGNNTAAGFVTKYLLTNASGLILQQVSNPFTLPNASGDYLLYTINYDAATGTAPTTTAGINIAAIGGTCVAVGAPLVISACPIQIAGNVFHDIAGLTDNTVNGTGTNVTSLLFANLVSSGGTVVQSVPVNPDGSFAFPNVSANTTYTVVIATSATATTPNLPTGWANTGDNIGANAGSDTTPNGVLTVAVSNTNIVDINFGIEQPPSANVFVEPSQSNPGGTAQALVTGTSFSGSDPDGTVTDLIITNFPSNATSITVDGVNYTAATFPVGGITVPTSANGTPTQVITIDPIDGVTSVVIPYKTVDDAGLPSAVAGSVTVPFVTQINIAGNVFNDANGITDATVNGTGTNVTGLLFANLVSSTATIVQSVPVNADGSFAFPNVSANTTYTVIIATSATATTPNLPTGWVNTGDNIGTSAGNDGTINGSLTVAVATGNVINVDFGIEQTPSAATITQATQANPGTTLQATVLPTTFGGTDPDGTIASLTITSFPTNVTSITINGINYTSATFPVGGVNVPTTTSGQPTQTITIDPIDGTVNVVIAYITTDNAGFTGRAGTATVPFAPCNTPPTGPLAATCAAGMNEYLAVPRYVNGDPLAGGTTGSMDAFVVFPYGSVGQPGNPGYAPPLHSATMSQVGALWGVTAAPTKNTWYTTAVMKRHAGLGPKGLGGLYKFDMNTGLWTSFDIDAMAGVDLGTISRTPYNGMPLGANELPPDATSANWDVDAFAQAGKTGLGGVDASADGNTLWVMNLYAKELLQIDISSATPTLIARHAIPAPVGMLNGTHRPWAVKVHNSKVYVGMVADASAAGGTSANLKAYITSFDPVTSGWCSTYDFPLNFSRSSLHTPDGALTTGNWKPWIDAYTWTGTAADVAHAQPILSDIEFDMEGSMILGFLDRFAMQVGNTNYTTNTASTSTAGYVMAGGDVLRVGITAGVYALENNGVAGLGTGGVVTTSATNTLSPAGPGGKEFYWGEYFNYFNNGANGLPQGTNGSAHTETALGGLAFKPGSGEIRVASYDPYAVGNAGVIGLSNTDGSSINASRYEVYPAQSGLFGKGVGLGDLEYTCLPTNLGIGNLVFQDNNRDGNYDAGIDTPFSNVTVQLFDAPGGVVVSTTPRATITTGTGAAAGTYLFGNLTPGEYVVRIANTNFTGAGALTGFQSSAGNSSAGDDDTTEDGIDAEGAVSSGVIALGMTSSPIGAAESGINGTTDDATDAAVNLTVDFGFVKKYDLGDLPDASAGTSAGNYETTLADNGAAHQMTTSLMLGSAVDAEYDGQSSTLANGDDNVNVLRNLALLGTASQSSTLSSATANLANDGNTNGVYGNGSVTHTYPAAAHWWKVDLPNAATLSQIVLWNRTDCCGDRLNGALVEILDAGGTVVWSGNISSTASVTNTLNPPSIVGKTVRVSVNAYALSLAEVQVFGTMDDEDGVTIPALVKGATSNVSIKVANAGAGAKLNAFFDWNADGDFADANETITELTVINGNNTLAVNVPASAVIATNLGARFRLSAAGGLSANGIAPTGEVEDYMVTVSALNIAGNVFHDIAGLTDATVNGTGTNVTGLLFANLVSSGGTVVQSVPVNADGSFAFPNITANTTYIIIIATSATATTPNLPTGWVNTGDNIGVSAGNDGTINGSLTVVVATSDITNVNFGIEQPPAAGIVVEPTQLNPGSTTQVTVTPTSFSGTDPDGTIASLTITNFPTNATSITINGTNYTSTTFPVGGVNIPTTTGGVPTQIITIDPFDGAVSVVITYNTTDNAGFTGTSGTVTVPFNTPGSVGNFVWLDANGDGLQNDGATAGINGVEVQLWDLGADGMVGGTGLDADTQVGATIQTANDPVTGNPGFYNFIIIESGNYFVQFPSFTGSSILSPQTSNSATDGNSDANTITGQSPPFTIDVNGTGQVKDNTTIDAGFSTPKFETQLVFKKYDCTNNKAIVQVQVRSKAGNPDFYMNDANFRINYDATHLTNPSIAAQENFSSVAPANDVFYDPQNLNGSVAGMVSLQIIAEGTGTAPKLVGNTWTTVSCLAFDIASPTATSTLTWNNDTAFPPTGMNAAVLPSMDIFNVAAAGVFNNLTIAPLNTHLASLAITASSNSPITSGGAITLSASTPAGGALPISFAWTSTTGFTSNAQNPTITAALVADAGTYTVQVTDVNGCSASSTVLIVVNVLPAALGNRVWLDEGAGTNAHNGIQDADEVGVSGVTVTLYQCSPLSGGAGGGCVIVNSTKTDAYGNYLFANLVPNNYTVGFSLPINYVFSPKGTGTDSGTATDSDVDNIATSATFGRSNSVTLSAGETDLNVDAGIYFETPNTQSIGDFVWFDADGNGVQNATEKGISGVTVTLYDVTGTTVIASTITDGEGKYLFRDLAVGSYTIGFGEVVGLALTSRTNFTADGSDADPLSRKTGIIALAAGENRTDIDAGMVLLAVEKCALGDKVWFDTNNDGLQGANEGGVAGVVVQLYDAMNVNIGTTVTDVFGNYLFNNLDAGRYYVMFDGTTLPTGYTFVNENQGSDDTNDSDCHNTGLGAGMTGWYSLAPGDKNLTIDAGIFNSAAPLGGLGNFVWLDANKDGIQNDLPSSGGVGGGFGFGGITVTLYAADGTTVVATTATDKTGFYAFNNLPQGDYVVGFSNLPQGYSLTTPNAATSTATNNSDANAGSGKTALITVGTTFRDDIDAGIYPNGSPSGTASLGDIVWYDTNNDGVQNVTEVGVNNVTVNLLNANTNTIIASQKTDATGHYLFTGLAAGDYKVEFVTASLPVGYNFVTQNAGTATEATNSDANTSTGFTDIITLSSGEDNLTIDAGIYKPNTTLGSIGNFVWNDLDGNGVQNAGELGVTGISVRLLDATTGALVAITMTDRNGYYLFPDLPYGAYTVEFGNLPQGYVFTPPNTTANGGDDTSDSDADALTGKTATITINASTPNNSDTDAGIRTTLRAGLGDYAWFDTDGDGIQNDGVASRLSGVLVTLYDAANPALRLAAAITDVNGYYSFLNLDPAVDYVVGFEKTPLGAKFTQRTLATADGSDADANTGLTPMVSLAPGEYNPRIDAGVTAQKAGLGDYVWLDANGDGIQNEGASSGISGVLVTLYDAVTNAVLAKAETDGTGYYSFSNLAPGTYYVGFDATTLPLGAIFTPQNAAGSTPENGSDVLPATGKTGNITLVAGEFNANIDAGVQIVKAALGDFVWLDLDKNGIQNNDPTTGAAFEQPLANTKIYLFAAGNLTTPIDSTTTGANGSYWFMNLTPGDYVVGFGSSTLYTRTITSGVLTGAQASETPVFNSDASVLTGKTGTISLAAGQRNATIDAGYYGTTLPVKLVYFKGNADACEVHLQWATASEQNAKSFEIWRSTDGINYTKIGTQKAAGNSTNMQFYTFTDTKPLRTNYYKLVQTDFDGKSETFALSAKIATNGCFEDTDNGISGLYPNPNGVNTLNLKFYTDRSDSEDLNFVFYDVLGRAIATYPQTIIRGANHVQLDITTLPSGTYFVKAVGEGWYSLPQKLVRVQ